MGTPGGATNSLTLKTGPEAYLSWQLTSVQPHLGQTMNRITNID